MAIVKNNILTQGLSGTIGHTIMFRQVNGRTIATSARGANVNPPTPGQEAKRQDFREAARYAQACRKDAALLAFYAAAGAPRKLSAQNMAISDFMIGPVIEAVDVQAYTGRPGSIIRVKATDNVAVAAVRVRITDAAGTEAESGEAVQEPGATDWRYTTNAAVSHLPGVTIWVQAQDIPGNTAEATVAL